VPFGDESSQPVAEQGNRRPNTCRVSCAQAMNLSCLLRRALLCVIVFVSLLSSQTPQETNPAPKPSPELAGQAQPSSQLLQVPPQLTKEDIAAFLDGVVPIQLQRDDMAGAVVVIVKDGQVLFAKGYGFADEKTRKPVSVEDTLFRPGSISKTFTWTAVMQLYEQGKIDLDRDVNDYLDFKMPARFGKPVTMRHLMTHTAGWEESVKELFVANASDLYPLDQYLKKRLPKQIYPPGTTPAYSNYGAALAGYIVSRVSGMPFEEYVDKNIYQPLGMTHATFRQPLPDNLKPLMSEGYDQASNPAKGFEFVEAYPAGSMSVSAADMAKFMIAHLQNGEYNGARILKPETAQLMHSRLFGLVPQLNGMAYGFYEETRNGHRIIGHGGDTQWFHSDMHLVPDQNLGFFVSYNSEGKGAGSPRTILWESFLDRYFPFTPPEAQPVASAAADAKAVAGTYWSSRRVETTIVSVISVLGEAKLYVNSDGTISLNLAKDFAGNPRKFLEIGPMLFREEHGQTQLAFIRDYAGQQIIVTDVPIHVWQPVPRWKNRKLNLAILLSSLAMFGLTVVFWPINAMLRRHYGERLSLSMEYRRIRRLVPIFCLLNILLVAALGFWMSSVDDNIAVFSSHYDGRLRMLQLLALVDVLGVIVGIWYFVRSWRELHLWFWTRAWNTLLMLAFIGYAAFVLNWHILNFSLNY
jgi:CubicO group peptidase (beta-lactamase class C family)